MTELGWTLFHPAGMLTIGLIPVAVLQVFALIFLPSLLAPGSKPAETGRAIYCYLMQTLGILLMSASGMPTVYAVLTGTQLSGNVYLALLMVFLAGGLTFLLHEHKALLVEPASRTVPHAIYWYTWKSIGYVVAVSAALSLLLTMLLLSPDLPFQWWVLPSILLLYGLLLSWCTRSTGEDAAHFNRAPMKTPPVPPIHPLKVVSKSPVPATKTAKKPKSGRVKGSMDQVMKAL
ncbi:MAG: hypothetical protein Greene041619_1058 [Candidatus Peregrinibacteria bacterium Greene0416_19]|nr:MAG: hypothetical protein Greene041619_1058 [Candidatus Peregrinibacteria bacterium Greene0416_19]